MPNDRRSFVPGGSAFVTVVYQGCGALARCKCGGGAGDLAANASMKEALSSRLLQIVAWRFPRTSSSPSASVGRVPTARPAVDAVGAASATLPLSRRPREVGSLGVLIFVRSWPTRHKTRPSIYSGSPHCGVTRKMITENAALHPNEDPLPVLLR